jgi:tyrosine-protein kinase Etk/Wzc
MVAVAILATIVSILIPDAYTATTTILPPLRKESLAVDLVGQLQTSTGLSASELGLTNPTDLCIAMLKSRSIQNAVVDQFDLRRVYSSIGHDEARRRLDGYSEILAEKEGQISISVTDHDPKRAAQIANAYVEQLRSLYRRFAQSQAKQRRAFYENRLAGERKELSAAEVSLREAQEKSGLVQPNLQTEAIVDAVLNTRSQIGIAEARLEVMGTYATPDNPDLQRAKVELSGLREQLAKLERSTGVLGHGNLEIPSWRLPQVELEYTQRTRNLKYHEALYEFLAKQAEAARMDEAGQGDLVQVIDCATIPEKRSGPRRLMIVLLATVDTFFLFSLWVMIMEFMQLRDQNKRLPINSSR